MKKWFVAAYLAALICASAQTYEQKIASAMESVDRVAAKGTSTPTGNPSNPTRPLNGI